METNYKAKVAVRAGENYCIRLPRKLVTSGNLQVGDVVEVSIKPKEVQDATD